MALKVDDILWYVPHGQRRGSDSAGFAVVIAKVGRKWATVKRADHPDGWWDARLSLDTLYADGGQYSSPGRAWVSREAYENAVAVNAAWRNFYSRLSYSAPDGADLEWIRAAHEKLGLPAA